MKISTGQLFDNFAYRAALINNKNVIISFYVLRILIIELSYSHKFTN